MEITGEAINTEQENPPAQSEILRLKNNDPASVTGGFIRFVRDDMKVPVHAIADDDRRWNVAFSLRWS